MEELREQFRRLYGFVVEGVPGATCDQMQHFFAGDENEVRVDNDAAALRAR